MSEFQEFTEDQLRIIRQELLPADTSQGEFELFVEQCYRSQLDPFSRQIMGTPGYSKGRFKLTIVTTIDGFRLIADRTGKYDGQTEQEWCGPDGVWRTVWLEDNPPAAARCGVYRKGSGHPSFAVMTWKESPGPGSKSPVWRSMPAHMLSKCAEALALRKAFPNDLSGLYTSDELPPEQPTKGERYKPEDLPNPHAYSLDEQDSLREIAEENRLAREQETVDPETRGELMSRIGKAKGELSEEGWDGLRDGLIEDGALLESGHMPDPLPVKAHKAGERRLLVAATPAPPEPQEPPEESGGARRWMKAEVMALTPDGMSEDQFLEALLVKANAMLPDANKGQGFESWRDLQKHPVLIAELLAQVEAGTLGDATQEAFL